MVVYLVTGANRGIGLEFVKQLASIPEAVIYATVRNELSAKSVEALLLQNVKLIFLDLESPLEKFVEAFKVIEGGVDVVIQNAGASSENSFISTLDYDIDEYVRLYTINTLGTVKVYKAIYPYLYKKDTGVVKKFIAISSGAGSIKDMFIGLHGYGISKAAVNYFVKQIALEHSQSSENFIKNSVALALAPGMVDTDMAKEAIATGNPDILSMLQTTEKSVASMLKVIEKLSVKDNGNFYDFDGRTYNY